jgi:hypothetical protein
MKEWMSFRIIRDMESLTLFQAETARRIQVELPLDYLQRSKVVALISRDRKRIHGGFVIADTGPLRALEQLPDGWVESHGYLNGRRDACFEVNGFWLNHRDARSFACFSLYAACFAHIAWQAIRGKYYFVYAFDAEKKSLGEMFASFHSVRVFEGEVKALSGMGGPGREIVEVCSLPRLLYSAAKRPGFIFRRMRPRNRSKKIYA